MMATGSALGITVDGFNRYIVLGYKITTVPQRHQGREINKLITLLISYMIRTTYIMIAISGYSNTIESILTIVDNSNKVKEKIKM